MDTSGFKRVRLKNQSRMCSLEHFQSISNGRTTSRSRGNKPSLRKLLGQYSKQTRRGLLKPRYGQMEMQVLHSLQYMLYLFLFSSVNCNSNSIIAKRTEANFESWLSEMHMLGAVKPRRMFANHTAGRWSTGPLTDTIPTRWAETGRQNVLSLGGMHY